MNIDEQISELEKNLEGLKVTKALSAWDKTITYLKDNGWSLLEPGVWTKHAGSQCPNWDRYVSFDENMAYLAYSDKVSEYEFPSFYASKQDAFIEHISQMGEMKKYSLKVNLEKEIEAPNAIEALRSARWIVDAAVDEMDAAGLGGGQQELETDNWSIKIVK